jgi:hypothetical protein
VKRKESEYFDEYQNLSIWQPGDLEETHGFPSLLHSKFGTALF